MSLLFVGSSTVQRGIDPRVVDRELDARGIAVRSFNFGLPGMGTLESDHLLRTLLADRPPGLRWCVIEVLDRPAPARQLSSSRATWWHTPRQTLRAFRRLTRGRFSSRERIDRAGAHVGAFARRFANAGLGSAHTLGLRRGSHRPAANSATADNRGFVPLDDDPRPVVATRRRRFLATQKAYRLRVAQLRAGTLDDRASLPPDPRLLHAQVDALRRAGIEPIYVTMPVPEPMTAIDRLASRHVVPTLLRFNDPTSHPELFACRNRHDENHLSARGARVFSKALAEALAPLMHGTRHEPPTGPTCD